MDERPEPRGGAAFDPAGFARWIAELTGGPVPAFEKVERQPPADGVVIEGDDVASALAKRAVKAVYAGDNLQRRPGLATGSQSAGLLVLRPGSRRLKDERKVPQDSKAAR